MTIPINPQFVANVAAGITYWQGQTDAITDQSIWQLDAERQNLHRAITFGLKLPETWRDTAVIAIQSFPLIERRGYWVEWIPLLERAVARCSEHEPELEGRLLNRLGQAHRLNRQFDQAIAAHHASEALARRHNNEQALAEAWYNLSQSHLYARHYDLAEQYGTNALAYFERPSIPHPHPWLMFTLNTLGETARFQGQHAIAQGHFTRAIALSRQHHETLYVARFLSNQALTYIATDQFADALDCLTQARDILASTANELDVSTIQINIGLLYYRMKRWPEAEAAFRQADSDFLRRSPNLHLQAQIANNIGNVCIKQSKLVEAENSLRRSVALYRQTHEELELANAIGSLGEALLALERKAEARDHFTEALTLLEKFPHVPWAQKMRADFSRQQALIE